MGNLFSFYRSAAHRKRIWDLNVKERGIQKLCEKCERQCKVLGSSNGTEIKSKFICFVFKSKKIGKNE